MDMGPAVMAPSALSAEEQRRQDDLEREKLFADQAGGQHASAPSDARYFAQPTASVAPGSTMPAHSTDFDQESAAGGRGMTAGQMPTVERAQSIAARLNESAARSDDPAFQSALDAQAKALGHERYKTMGADGKVTSEFRPIGQPAPGPAAGPAALPGLPPVSPVGPQRGQALPRGGTAWSGPADAGAPAGIFDASGKLVASPGYAGLPPEAPQVVAANTQAFMRDHPLPEGYEHTVKINTTGPNGEEIAHTFKRTPGAAPEANVTNGTDATNGGAGQPGTAAPWSPFAAAPQTTGAYAQPKAANPGEQFMRNAAAASPNSAAGKLFARPLAAVDRQRTQAAGAAADQAEQQRVTDATTAGINGDTTFRPQNETQRKAFKEALQQFHVGQKVGISQENADTRQAGMEHAFEIQGERFANLKDWQAKKDAGSQIDRKLRMQRELREQGVSDLRVQELQQKIDRGEQAGNQVTEKDGSTWSVDANGHYQQLTKPDKAGLVTITDTTPNGLSKIARREPEQDVKAAFRNLERYNAGTRAERAEADKNELVLKSKRLLGDFWKVK